MPGKYNTKKSRSIWDKRCNGKEGDELLLIADGQQSYDESNNNMINFVLVFHQSYLCFELVIFSSAKCEKVWTRFYMHQYSIFEKIDDNEFQKLLEEKKDFFRKRHRHFTIDSVESEVRNEIATNLIQMQIPDLINYDCYQRILDQPVDNITSTILDIFGNPAVYKVYELSSVALLSPKPECLVPVNIEKIHMEAKYKQFLQSERLRKQMQLAVEIMQSNLKARPFKIAMKSSRSGSSGFFDFSSLIGSIRASFTGVHRGAQYDPNNHGKFPVETPNRSFGEKLRRSLSGILIPSTSGKFSRNRPIFLAPGSASIQPSLDYSGSDKELTAAKSRWLKATNRVINRNMHEQVTEVLKEKNILTNSGKVVNSGIITNENLSTSLQAGESETQLLLSSVSGMPASSSSMGTAISEEIRLKPDAAAENASLGNRLMRWAGMNRKAKAAISTSSSISGTKMSPSRGGNHDVSSKSVSPIGSHHSAAEQSLRKFKTQYPLSHQVAAERQQNSSGLAGASSPKSISSTDSSFQRRAQVVNPPLQSSIIAEP